MDRSSRQKINKETLNNTLGQINVIDIHRTFYPKAAQHTSFSSAHGTFSRRDHMLGHKTSLNKFKTEILSIIFSDQNAKRLQNKTKQMNKQKTTTTKNPTKPLGKGGRRDKLGVWD